MSVDLKTGKPFPRGAKPSPRHKLLAAVPHVVVEAPPPQFAAVPTKLSYWLNAQYGVCTISEEAAAKGAWSVLCGLPDLFVPDSEVDRIARKYGFLDGATLTDAMDAIKSDGFVVNGVKYHDGGYNSVDYSDEVALQSAISTGAMVKIAIDAAALPPSAGNQQGWYSFSGGRYPNTDHCVGLCGYGPAEFLYRQLAVPLPPALAGMSGYLLFTWDTIGFVTHDWLMGTCTESWVRVPTTPEQSPVGPPPPPPPPPPGPTREAVVIPDQQITTGSWPFRAAATVRGGTYPVVALPAGAVAGLGGFDLFALLARLKKYLPAALDVVAILVAIRTGNFAGLPPEVVKLLADLGFGPAA